MAKALPEEPSDHNGLFLSSARKSERDTHTPPKTSCFFFLFFVRLFFFLLLRLLFGWSSDFFPARFASFLLSAVPEYTPTIPT